MTPYQRYQSDLEQGLKPDTLQQQAIQQTQRLFTELNREKQEKKSILEKLLNKKSSPIKGLYLWGGTGRGKTYLMDSFYECLEEEKKHRVHFHSFMLEVHQKLRNLSRSANPLDIIADQLAREYKILCLDEFHVHDIADAMLLAGLLKSMFEKGIVLVATSNIAIHDLYQNGLQRERFLYAIELLEKYTDEVNLGDGTDYRFNILDKGEYYYLIDEKNSQQMATDFLLRKMIEISPCQPKNMRSIEINNREIKYQALADDVIWFGFSDICQTARSAHDYIEIAQRFHTVFVSDIDVMRDADDNAAKRFIHLVDALYDHNVKLVVTAFATAGELYLGNRMAFAFNRTISRLTEMGTEHYLKLAHNPTGTARSLSRA